MEIDINCDLGEGGAHDAELMGLVTSVNIACGFHAGDPATAAATLHQAARLGVCAGAHPGFPDRENFGRLDMARTEREVFEDTVYQVGALAGLARAAGIGLCHLKPHGALYNQACRDAGFARPVVATAELFGLALVGLPGSRLQALSAGRCRFIPEGFADRCYLPDGSLVPRTRPDAFVEDTAQAVLQVRRLVTEQGVRTVCVHGDNPHAVQFARALREGLTAAGFRIVPPGETLGGTRSPSP
jgi:UPF0271 protein